MRRGYCVGLLQAGGRGQHTISATFSSTKSFCSNQLGFSSNGKFCALILFFWKPSLRSQPTLQVQSSLYNISRVHGSNPMGKQLSRGIGVNSHAFLKAAFFTFAVVLECRCELVRLGTCLEVEHADVRHGEQAIATR